jgi:hypothetical protein
MLQAVEQSVELDERPRQVIDRVERVAPTVAEALDRTVSSGSAAARQIEPLAGGLECGHEFGASAQPEGTVFGKFLASTFPNKAVLT